MVRAKRKNGVTVLNEPRKVNPIEHERDNTSDLQEAELRARSKRKWEAPDSSTPGKKTAAPPFSQSSLPG